MALSFFETMSGEVHDSWGKSHLAEFSIKAESASTSAFLTTGRTAISGVFHCLPWADELPLHGEFVISALRKRVLRYDFEASAGEGEPIYRFVGIKRLRLGSLLHSVTHLEGSLSCDGVELARGVLDFDLNTLPSFAASWWTSAKLPRVEFLPDAADTKPSQLWSQSEERFWQALSETLISAGEIVPAVSSLTLDALAIRMAQMPAQTRFGLSAAMTWLQAVSWRRHRKSFDALSVEQRTELIADLRAKNTKLGGALSATMLLQLLGVPVKSAHFGRDDYLEAVGYPTVQPIKPEPAPRHFERVKYAEDLPSESVIYAEVAVVGTGAGGAAVAAELAEQGHAVVMLEEGRYNQRHDFVGKPADRLHKLYRDGGMTMSLGTPISIPQGRGVGGTTTVNSGTCFATPDHVLQQWRDELGFPDDFAPHNYQRFSASVAQMLQVAYGEPEVLGKISGVISRGAQAMHLPHGPLPRNAPGCTGAGECIFGCPEAAKRSTDQSYVPAALKAGAELYVGLPVTRVLRRGRRVVALEAHGVDQNGAPKRLRIVAERYVLSMGSLQTPVFLQENGFSLPRLGRNLSVHPAAGLIARGDEDLQPWKAIPQGYAIEALQEEGVRYEGFFLPPQILALQMPMVGAELSVWMDDFAKLAQFGFMVRDKSVGRVMRGSTGQPVVLYRLDAESQRRLKKAAALLAELMLRAGNQEVYVPIGANTVVRTLAEAQSITDMRTNYSDFRLLGAHPLGTCAMAASAEHGVVDFDYRVFGTDNLHIVDGSVVPTSLGVNPQMTIMAQGLRAAERIGGLV